MKTHFQDVLNVVQIQGAFAVSSKSKAGLEALKKAICSFAQEWLSKINVPSSYHHFLELLEHRPAKFQENENKYNNKVLLWKDIQTLACYTQLNGVEETVNCLEFLHESGLIVFISNVCDNLESKESQSVVITDTQVNTFFFFVLLL